MAQNPFRSASFAKLKSKWYKKLEDKGFNDVEYSDENLKFYENDYFYSRYGPARFYAKKKYFELAGQFLEEHKFDNKIEKKIWALHSVGATREEISKKLKIGSLGRISNIIQKLKTIMIYESHTSKI